MADCIFCKIVAGKLPAIKIHEDDLVLAFMVIHPLRRGHILIIPKQHQQHLHALPAETRTRLFHIGANLAEALYASSLKPAAVHYLVNDGPAAHQSVPHVHLHVLPRYRGDSAGLVARLLRQPFNLILGQTSAKRLEKDAREIGAMIKN